jgi:hypothetical protein
MARLTQRNDVRQIKYQGEILRGACPEPVEILRCAQNDINEWLRMAGKV